MRKYRLFDTFSPVTRITSIHVLSSLVASNILILHQLDVKTAFLNGDLEENIYMDQSEGYVVHGQENKVCKLNNLFIVSKRHLNNGMINLIAWQSLIYLRLMKVIDAFIINMKRTFALSYVFYVDDLLIFCSNIHTVENVQSLLYANFDIKDLGEASVIFGIKLLDKKGNFFGPVSLY